MPRSTSKHRQPLRARLPWLQRRTPGSLLGRASSAFAAAEGGAGLIGITLGGVLIGLAGLTATVATAGLAIAGGAVLAAILLRVPPPASVPSGLDTSGVHGPDARA